jgi:glyoxylase-like metal-dependent hydrolase (beta-lactamase superfamily II)
MFNKQDQIHRISLPLPFSLKQVTVYVVESNGELTLIDTGLHTEETRDVWQTFFRNHHWTWQQVEKIIITHYHPDHYGFAGVLQEWSGATVYMAEKEYNQIQSLWNRSAGDPAMVSSFFANYGFPTDRLTEITKHMESFRSIIEPHPIDFEWLEPSNTIQIGTSDYQIIETPGHSDGHLSFLHENEGSFFAGDIILPKITPNIPLLPGGDENPLATFFTTLDKINDLEIRLVYPAHGEPFYHVSKRIAEIKEHHDQRLQKIVNMMKDKQVMTGFQVCEQLFVHRNLDIHNLRFAFSETLSHLEYLRQIGELQRSVSDGVVVYSI